MNLNFQEALLKQLKILKTKYNLIGIKSEFKAEEVLIKMLRG